MEQWRSYLQMKELTIITDKKALVSLTKQRLHTAWQQKALTKLMGLNYQIVYRKGADNRAADALSRRPHPAADCYMISSVQPAWIQEIVQRYAADMAAQAVLQKLTIDPDADPKFTLRDGLLRYKKRMWIGADDQF